MGEISSYRRMLVAGATKELLNDWAKTIPGA